jgi:hypothetical protein
MSNRTARTVVSAFLVSFAAAGVLSAAPAAVAANVPADQYGYAFRSQDAFTDGARATDAFTDGARKVDSFTDGARQPETFTDGAGQVAVLRRADPFLDGARAGKADPYLDGANA